jgi:hypothetical protein
VSAAELGRANARVVAAAEQATSKKEREGEGRYISRQEGPHRPVREREREI